MIHSERCFSGLERDMVIPPSTWLSYAPLPLSLATYGIRENISLRASWGTTLPNHSVTVKGNRECCFWAFQFLLS